MPNEQVSTEVFTGDIFYALGTVGVIVGIVGLAFIDSALTKRRNALDNWLGKLLAGVSTAVGFVFVGYGIWWWQYYQALGVPSPLKESISDWWLGGDLLTTLPQTLNPVDHPSADVSVLFLATFLVFAMFLGAFIHSAGLDRLKPPALYGTCFVVGATAFPILSYLTWGSSSPLTNDGLHDYTGVFALYLFAGTISVVLNWRLGARRASVQAADIEPSRLAAAGTGVLLLMFALPLIVLVSGWLFPGTGYFGISFTTTSVGMVVVGVFLSFIGGAVSGAILSALTREPVWVLLGPIAGYIACGTLFDVVDPWKVLVVSLAGPPCFLAAQRLIAKLGVEDAKIGPLTLGPGIVGVVVGGLLADGVATGGYPGLEGDYALQHAQITLGDQLIGIGVSVGIGLVTALILTLVAERTVGLRVSDRVEEEGLDTGFWIESGPLTAPAAAGPTDAHAPARSSETPS